MPLLLAAAAIAFQPAVRAPFQFDDAASIVDNTTIRQLWPLSVPLSPPPNTAVSGRPLVNLSLAINYAANQALGIDQRPDPDGPDKTVGFHVVNILLHLTCGVLLFALVRRTLHSLREEGVGPGRAESWRARADPIALAVAALWLLHPIQTEAVDYVVQRTELIAAAYYLGAIYCSARAWDAASGGTRTGWYGAAAIACLLGVASKEVVVTVPLIIVLYDRAFRQATWRDTLRGGRAGFYGLLAVVCGATFALVASGARAETVGFQLGVTWYQYLYSQAWAIAHYLTLAIWPRGLTFDYGQRAITGLRGFPGAVIVAALAAGTLMAWRRAKWLGFLGAWFFVILAPSSSFVPIRTEIAAERRFYLPLIAVIVAVVIGAEIVRRRWKAVSPRTAGIVVIALCAILGGLTYRRSSLYNDPEALWRDAVTKVPGNARAYDNLAAAIVRADERRAPEAEALLRQAIATDSSYLPAYPNLASIISRTGNLAEARALLERAVALKPDYVLANEQMGILLAGMGDAARAVPYLERVTSAFPTEGSLIALGTAYLQLGRPDDAGATFRRALALNPARADAERFLGSVLTEQGRSADALPYLESAVKHEPESALGVALLGVALADAGHPDEAATDAARAVAIEKANPAVLMLAGRAMLRAQHLSEAETYLVESVKLNPLDPEALTRLGIAKAALGKRDEAERSFRRALIVQPNYGPATAGLAKLGRPD
jgi:tetratricopeptide (TPR) repeat protein